MPDLHELLVREASRGGPVSAPAFETLIARSRQRRLKQALAVAGVVVAVAAAIAVPLSVRGRGAVVVIGPDGVTTDAARRAVAQQVVDQMVADVNLPVGASPQATAPAFPTFQGPTKDSVTAVRYFSVQGTMDSVIAYVTAHPPAGLFANGTTESSSGTVESRGVDFAGAATSSYGAPELSVAVVLQGTGVGVSVSAQAVLRPLRTTAEQVPANVAAVTVTLRQSDGVAYEDSWESPQAQVLAGALNALDTQLPNSTDTGCGSSDPVYTVTFEVSHQPLVFSDYGCGVTDVTAAGVTQPPLESGNVESRIYGMLGLEPAPQSSAPPAGAVPPAGASSPAP